MTSLHQNIKQKAKNGLLQLSDLKPNSRLIAQRMIANGELLISRCGRGYVLAEGGK